MLTQEVILFVDTLKVIPSYALSVSLAFKCLVKLNASSYSKGFGGLVIFLMMSRNAGDVFF
jgi:hypothetical protein